MTGRRIRVLFFAEAVTLAHVARPVVLAGNLDPERYEVHFAWHPRYRALFEPMPFHEHRIFSIEPGQFTAALARGSVLYDVPVLESYVREDLRLLREVEPDLVVGDFRLSLSISARVFGRPYFGLGNAYWSPYIRQRYPVPALPFVRYLGVGIAQRLFDALRPLAFRLHARPINQVRSRWQLPALPPDVRYAYTDADYTLYADTEWLFPIPGLPGHHRYLGPVLWSPRVPLPPWWDALPAGQPLVYLNLGSSGPAGELSRVVEQLARQDITLLVATAGAALSSACPENVFTADYLPNDLAMQRADVVICNGGSMSCYQAYALGKPVIAVAGNLDQFLNSQAGAARGLCRIVRADRLGSAELSEVLRACLSDAGLGREASHFADVGGSAFARLLEECADAA